MTEYMDNQRVNQVGKEKFQEEKLDQTLKELESLGIKVKQ